MGGSGSGSGPYIPSGPTNICEKLVFDASVNSPHATILQQLSVGDLLDVVSATAPANSAIVLYEGQPLGALTGTKVGQLLNCIREGFEFQAEVIVLSGGNCTVRVELA